MPKARTKAAPAPVEGPAPAKLSTYVSEFLLSVGPMTTVGKLVNVGKTSKVGSFVTMCPDCHTPEMKVRYACPNPSHVMDLKDGSSVEAAFEPGTVLKAKKLPDGSFAPASAEEIAAARSATLPRDEIDLHIYRAADVNDLTWSDDNAYVFIPRHPQDKTYGLLVDEVAEGEYAFVGVSNLRNHEGFFRLATWQRHLVLQKCLFPEECASIEDNIPPADPQYRDALKAMLERAVQPFDPREYTNGARERLAALEVALANGGTYTPPEPKVAKESAIDLLAALESFAASKGKKK